MGFADFFKFLIDPAGLFQKKAPTPLPAPAPPPKAPTIDEAAKVQEESDSRRRRRGRAATILTGEEGAGTPTTAAKALTGE